MQQGFYQIHFNGDEGASVPGGQHVVWYHGQTKGYATLRDAGSFSIIKVKAALWPELAAQAVPVKVKRKLFDMVSLRAIRLAKKNGDRRAFKSARREILEQMRTGT